MSSISAVSTGIAMQAPPPATPQGSNKAGKSDGDGDHGVEPTPTAQMQPAQTPPAGGSTGSSGVVNLTA